METTKYIPKNYSFPKTWTEKQYFVYACFVPDLQAFYAEWIEQGKSIGRAQFFDSAGCHKYWIPSNICCESGEILMPDNIDVKVGYWSPFIWKPIRKDLKQQATKDEAFECQKIDASCNDCKHLYRQNNWCNKFDRKTKVYENLCHPQNQLCFEHRRG